MLQIIQNDPEVPLGNLAEHLTVPYQLHHPYKDGQLPRPAEITALIVLGGAMGANDEPAHPFLTDLKVLIRQVVAAGIPYLGICLGGQLLASAFGAQVVSNRWEELGTLPVQLTAAGLTDPLLSGMPQRFSTFQWHHDSFDLPDQAVLLASSPACPHQAFRVGANAWGLQFHPEVTETIIRSWAAWDPVTAQQTEALVTTFSAQTSDYRQISRQLLHNFLQTPTPTPPHPAAGQRSDPDRPGGDCRPGSPPDRLPQESA